MMSSFYFMHDFRVFRSGTLLQHKVAASAASTQQKDPPAKVSSLLLEHLLRYDCQNICILDETFVVRTFVKLYVSHPSEWELELSSPSMKTEDFQPEPTSNGTGSSQSG